MRTPDHYEMIDQIGKGEKIFLIQNPLCFLDFNDVLCAHHHEMTKNQKPVADNFNVAYISEIT